MSADRDLHTVTLDIAPYEGRLYRVYQLWCDLQPHDWRVIWEYYSPGKPSRLRCEGPSNPEALKIVEDAAAQLPLLERASA